MVLFLSHLGVIKGTPWILQLVFNKILTFPLDQCWAIIIIIIIIIIIAYSAQINIRI